MAFKDDYFILVLKSSVVNLGQLDEGWYDIGIHREMLTMSDQHSWVLIKVPRGQNRLYRFFYHPVQLMCLIMGHVSDAWRWHARLGHQHFDGVRKMANGDLISGLPDIMHVDELCYACLAGKQRCLPFPEKACYRA